ncbi:MAG: divalent-cation tolerance protein CutA [Polyangia bacterium]|jgi:periplasmic divalent cation tolerance protein|nr:divalent-cation tolerance protein CutA [Polyangia bacterium]
MQSEHLVVFVTAPNGAGEAELARALVRERLAACVNLVPSIRSFYVWEDKQQDDCEVLLVIKTTRERYAALEARVRELHPYQVPEIIALPIVAGQADYLSWVTAGTQAPP